MTEKGQPLPYPLDECAGCRDLTQQLATAIAERDAAEMRELELQRNAILLINKIEALRQQLADMTQKRDEALQIAREMIVLAPITDADVKWAEALLAAQKHQEGLP